MGEFRDMDKNFHHHKESRGPWRNWEAEMWHRNLFHMPGGVLLVKRLGFTNAGAGIPALNLSFHSGLTCLPFFFPQKNYTILP